MPVQLLQGSPEPAPANAQGRAKPSCTRRNATFAGALWLAALLSFDFAHAQGSGSANVVSDYRYRGVTLSDNEPAAQLGAVYDAPEGSYAGAFVSTVKLDSYERGWHAIAFGGRTWRISPRWSLEAGGDYAVVTARPRFDYAEAYAGFATQDVSGRVYYSPHYFGQDASAVYIDLNVAQPLMENVRLLAHVGALHTSTSRDSTPLIDGALGIGLQRQRVNLQLSWVGTNYASGAYSTNRAERRNGAVASVSCAF